MTDQKKDEAPDIAQAQQQFSQQSPAAPLFDLADLLQNAGSELHEDMRKYAQTMQRLHETNIMLIGQNNAIQRQLQALQRRSSEAAMKQVEQVITEQMQKRMQQYDAVRFAAEALLCDLVAEANADCSAELTDKDQTDKLSELADEHRAGLACDLLAALQPFLQGDA